MDKGKSQWHYYNATCDVLPLLPRIHPQGISISLYCFDRGIWSSLGNRMLQKHAAYHNLDVSNPVAPLSASAVKQLHLDWHVVLPCANHDCQNGMRWAVQNHLKDPRTGLSDLFIVIASIRNIFNYLVAWLPRFLQLKLEFVDLALADEWKVYQFWSAMGFSGDYLTLTADLNP
eukprot:5378243-Karenia_brevis.AAC.1